MSEGTKKDDKKEIIHKLKVCLFVFMLVSIVGTPLFMYIGHESTTVDIPDHTSKFYVNDYSHVFSKQTEQFIYAQAKDLYEKTGAQIVVASVPQIYDTSLEDFSLNMARKWGIGNEEKDSGVLLLYTTNTAHVRLEVGYGLEGSLNDAKCGRILDDYSVEQMNNGDWNEAAVYTWTAIAKVVYEEYNLEIPKTLTADIKISEIPSSGTEFDSVMPDPVIRADERSFLVRALESFAVLWMFAFSPGVIIALIYLRGVTGSSGNYRGGRYYGGYNNKGGGFGGGNFGGGGGFGGGGASR